MKQLEAVKAYKVLAALGTEKLPVNTAFALFKQKRALQPAYDFQAEQEKAIAERYNATLDDRGYYHADTEEHGKAMRDELTALSNNDCTLEIGCVDVDVPQDFKISMTDLETLEPFINFKY